MGGSASKILKVKIMEFEEFFSADKIYITVAVIATLLLFLVSVLIGVTTRRRQREGIDHFKYRPRKHLMVGSSKQCFQILNNLFGQKFYVIPNVSLSSLLSHKVGVQDRYAAYKYIEDKTIDFVLCNKRTLRPICAIKLEDGIKGDPKTPGGAPEEMSKFFRSAHLPFVYLARTQRLTEAYIIEEFSRVVYEISKIKPAPRGRRPQEAKPTPSVNYPSQTLNAPHYFDTY